MDRIEIQTAALGRKNEVASRNLKLQFKRDELKFNLQ